MLSALIVHARPEPALALTLSRLVEGALAGVLADVTVLDLAGDPLATQLADEGGCAVLAAQGDPGAAIRSAVAQARADWLLVAASGLAPAPGWPEAARETLTLAAAGAKLGGAVFVAPRRGWFAPRDGVVLARRAALARARLSPLRAGRDAARAARRDGRLRLIAGLCDDERR